MIITLIVVTLLHIRRRIQIKIYQLHLNLKSGKLFFIAKLLACHALFVFLLRPFNYSSRTSPSCCGRALSALEHFICIRCCSSFHLFTNLLKTHLFNSTYIFVYICLLLLMICFCSAPREGIVLVDGAL